MQGGKLVSRTGMLMSSLLYLRATSQRGFPKADTAAAAAAADAAAAATAAAARGSLKLQALRYALADA